MACFIITEAARTELVQMMLKGSPAMGDVSAELAALMDELGSGTGAIEITVVPIEILEEEVFGGPYEGSIFAEPE